MFAALAAFIKTKSPIMHDTGKPVWQEYLSGCQQQGTAEMGRTAESFQSFSGHMTAAPSPASITRTITVSG